MTVDFNPALAVSQTKNRLLRTPQPVLISKWSEDRKLRQLSVGAQTTETHDDPETCRVGDNVNSSTLRGWPRMSDASCTAFRKFTGAGDDCYNLHRKGSRIFAVGSEIARCVYNHTREF